ncbi:hypothetical protein FXO37_08072 [Capsicum annuum]|nr:hypothetical protein FXO37_08072 [Capsicum annuum]
MVENYSYEQFSWGKSSFEKLIASWRQDFFVEKQLYSMGEMPHVLNVWMYEYCSKVDSMIAERMGNDIPRIFNWKVVRIKVKYEKFMGGMFNKVIGNTDKSIVIESSDDTMGDAYFDWNPSPIQEQFEEVEGCSEDIVTTRLDALVESVVNQKSVNLNIGTSSTVHIRKDHKDIEGVSAEIETATLEDLVEAVENQIPNNANVGTSTTMHFHKDQWDDYSSTIPESAQSEHDAILEGLAAPVEDIPLEVVPLSEEIINQQYISDSQLPPDFLDVFVAAHQAAKTPAKRIRIKSKGLTYASGSKDIEDQSGETKQKFTFDGFLISNDMPRGVIEEYKQWVEEGLLKFHAKNGFFEETSRTDWANIEAYRDKMSQKTQFVNQNYFEVEYIQDIMQQECNSVDCGAFVAGYAEYISERMSVPSVDFESEYHRMRYASLLQNYDIRKANKGYLSENDDPPRPRTKTLPNPNEYEIVSIE